MLISNNLYKEAEGILIELVKLQPGRVSILLMLGDVYMHASRPQVAIKVYEGIIKQVKNAYFLYLDLIQAKIICGKLREANDNIGQLLKNDYMSVKMGNFRKILLLSIKPR